MKDIYSSTFKLLITFIMNLIQTLFADCGYNMTLIKGNIFEGLSMDTAIPFHKINASTVHACNYACQHNCRCSSVVYFERHASSFDNCLLYNVTNINQYMTNDSFATLIYFRNKVDLYECPFDCLALLQSDSSLESGIYELIQLEYEPTIRAVCDMETDDGGWTLLQRRFDGSVDFFRNWSEYKNGFGNLEGEFWLGLDATHRLMKNKKTTLRFDLWDGTDFAFAEYMNAMISNEQQNYQISFMSYIGTAGDAMIRHNNSMFTTKDKHNDMYRGNTRSCANAHKGAWWYVNCFDASLNGDYGDSGHGMGIKWEQWRGHRHSLSKTEIKIRRSS